MSETRAPYALKRSPAPQLKKRPIYWHHQMTGMLQHGDSGRSTIVQALSLSSVLNLLAQSTQTQMTVFLFGGHDESDTPPADYWREPVWSGWRISKLRSDPASAAYVRNGCEISVYMAGTWFANTSDLDLCRRAYNELRSWLQTAFTDAKGRPAALYPTPAQTGLGLLDMSLPRAPFQLETLPEDLRTILYANNSQGRIELLTEPGGANAGKETLDQVACLDGRFMYWSCLRKVPSGQYVFDTGGYAGSEVPGFYEVTATPPVDWAHLGLLPHLDDAALSDVKTVYPRSGRFTTWATGAEVDLARTHGWGVEIHHRLIWPKPGDPLRTFHDKILDLRSIAETLADAGDERAPLIADALRAIGLHAIGAMNHHQNWTNGFAARAEDVPRDAYDVRKPPTGGGFSYRQPAPESPWHLRHAHPEICGVIWGRARRKLALMSLAMPLEWQFALRTDGIWLDRDPMLSDTGKPGAWRLKEFMPYTRPAPRSTLELLELMRDTRLYSKLCKVAAKRGGVIVPNGQGGWLLNPASIREMVS